ncbi:DNA cytosine methyltransferase [Mycobacterium intracellulare]|uniref:DNA cytosine methyltransferase n=1 Tax=Mycobacterium intracellulare TaxID=1767 RepID=UPI001CD920D5|nr:DNA cytosine methyltransferase [Mycobacterium intracellulare]MCA2304814.1 DNA cytosine methyltransferase [Mycobacterium intracellulare]MCA2347155.1 DNA cytosine methyltransferase [Mycobacterium intracellulare]
MTRSVAPRSAKLHAPELAAEHIAEIEAALAAAHTDWQPSGLATGITYTDIFCGFGGSSIGLENAGLTLSLGANHWQKAIETHALNFPHADHLIADVSNYDMRRLPDTDVLWASPICTELSPAGGTRRRNAQLSLLEPEGHVPTAALDRTRATFWDVVRATEVHRYKIILIENVVEAASWELFDIWLAAMDKLGYKHQFISVSSAHIGDDTNPHAPQWRDRLYIVFTAVSLPTIDIQPRPLAWCPTCDEINHAVQSWKRLDRRRIGKYRQQYVYRCPNGGACRHSIVEPFARPAAVAIDWTDLGQRIGDRDKPLAAATMRRIQAGIAQFAEPTVIATNHGSLGEDRAYPAARAPMPTRSTKIGDGVACPPFLLDRRAYQDGDARRIKPITDPVGAITANGRPHTLVTPPIVVPAGGSWNTEATSAAEPIRTRMTRDTDGVFTPQPWITVLRNHADVSSIDDPLAAVATGGGTGGGHQGLTVPPGAFIQKHHGGLDYEGIAHMTKSVNDPVPSVVARPNLSLVIPYRKGRAKTTDEPLHTVATRDSAALVAASEIDIADCRFRMLNPREHARAQRFPDDYSVVGNKSEQTMGFGNAVSSNVAQWLGGFVVRLLASGH